MDSYSEKQTMKHSRGGRDKLKGTFFIKNSDVNQRDCVALDSLKYLLQVFDDKTNFRIRPLFPFPSIT